MRAPGRALVVSRNGARPPKAERAASLKALSARIWLRRVLSEGKCGAMDGALTLGDCAVEKWLHGFEKALRLVFCGGAV